MPERPLFQKPTETHPENGGFVSEEAKEGYLDFHSGTSTHLDETEQDSFRDELLGQKCKNDHLKVPPQSKKGSGSESILD